MPKCYLLPCKKCDHKLEVEGRHAGRSLNCPQCDAPVEIPTFRDLKTLETTGDDPAPSKGSGSGGQSMLKGMLFTIGLGVAVVAGAGGWGLYNYASNMVDNTEVNAKEWSGMVNSPIEDATVVELWDVWANTIDGGALPDWQEAEWTRYNKQGKILLSVAYGIFGVAIVGLLVMMASFLIPQAKPF